MKVQPSALMMAMLLIAAAFAWRVSSCAGLILLALAMWIAHLVINQLDNE